MKHVCVICVICVFLLLPVFAHANAVTFDGKTLTATYFDSTGGPLVTLAGPTDFVVGDGPELLNFANAFDIDVHGNMLDLTLTSDVLPAVDETLFLILSWTGQGIYVQSGPGLVRLSGPGVATEAGDEAIGVEFMRDPNMGDTFQFEVALTDQAPLAPPTDPGTGTVPEPSSLLMLGSGVLALGKRLVRC